MRIIEFRGENFHRLRAARIRPDGRVVKITGKNMQGKTSVLDAIWAALKGRTVAGPTPVHKGCEEATIELAIGGDKVEHVIRRTFTVVDGGEFTTDLKIVSAGGKVLRGKKQEFLDALIPAQDLDPMEFARAKPAEQFEILRKLVPGFDFDANQDRYDAVFAARTEVNRLARQRRAQAEGVRLPAGPRPKPVDVAAKVDEMQRAMEANALRDRRQRQRDQAATDVDDKRDEAERLRARAATLEAEANSLEEKLAQADPIEDVIDVAAIKAEIESARAVAEVIRLHDDRDAHEAQAKIYEAQSASLTTELDQLLDARRKAIEAAKFPVPGLTLGDKRVLLDGVDFELASDAQKLQTSVAIAMAQPADLRVVRVRHGNDLDSDSMRLLEEMAAQHDFQVWVELVDESGEVGFVIVDGEVQS